MFDQFMELPSYIFIYLFCPHKVLDKFLIGGIFIYRNTDGG
jgi:hypothetical protein